MEPFRDDNELIAQLRALRPEPRPEFGAELDERVAANFPRRSSGAVSFLARLRPSSPGRAFVPAGAVALAAIAVATVVVATNEPKSDERSSNFLSAIREFSSPRAHEQRRQTEFSGEVPLDKQAGTTRPTPSSDGGSGVQYETEVPALTGHTASNAGGSASSQSADTGPYASKAGHRDIERSAEMVLGAEPADVAGDAAEVFAAVHAANGIVLSSSVTGGGAGDAGARFDLLIPAARLGDALANFSAIDTVVSRHEATDDITAPTVRTSEHLRDSRATIDGLLVQLASADSEEERAEVEAELRAERRHAAALRSQAADLGRRANLSRVSLRIETGAAATPADEDSGGWGIGDALGDVRHILGVAAAVTIVGLAIIAPLALIALLAWLANRVRVRRGRERALV
jgi:Domain of unknown function (DUF4349)